MSPTAEGYRAGWLGDTPASDDREFLVAFNEAVELRHKRDAYYVAPSKQKNRAKPTQEQRLSMSLRRPPGARFASDRQVASSTS